MKSIPSRNSWTFDGSIPVPESEKLADTVGTAVVRRLPAAGAVIETVGGVVSLTVGVVNTTTNRGAFPGVAPSRASYSTKPALGLVRLLQQPAEILSAACEGCHIGRDVIAHPAGEVSRVENTRRGRRGEAAARQGAAQSGLPLVVFASFGQFQVAPVSVHAEVSGCASTVRPVFPQLRPFFSTCSSSEAEITVAPMRELARLAPSNCIRARCVPLSRTRRMGSVPKFLLASPLRR